MNPRQNDPPGYGLTLFILEQGRLRKGSDAKNTVVAEIGKDITFDLSRLDTYHCDGWRPVHHDLLMVCAAVEFADRRCSRRSSQWSRSFNISIPVQALEVWTQQQVQIQLCNCLHHLTGDSWNFFFYQGEKSSIAENCQRSLALSDQKEFVIAYSEGLDSRAVSGIFDVGNVAVRVRLSKTSSFAIPGESSYDLVPFEVKLPKSSESSVRSRGFKFAAITAIAAQLARVSKIIVPESGQGALGPVILPLHNVYADYRNYPSFFRKMENFVKELLNHEVNYEQPRIWHTKGQTISTYLDRSTNSIENILNTRSCWQTRMNVRVAGDLRQCGLCAACLLRRLSMHAAKVDEPTNTYAFSDLTADNYENVIPLDCRGIQRDTMVQYGSVGVRHLQQMADLAEQSDDMLRVYSFDIARAMGALEAETLKKLRTLLIQHRDEWRAFVEAQGRKSFLNQWTKGGRYGRFE